MDGLSSSVVEQQLKQVNGKRIKAMFTSSDAGGCLERSMWGMWEEGRPNKRLGK